MALRNAKFRASREILMIFILLTISGIAANNSLTSSPQSSANGILIACSGDNISLTCTHNDTTTASTVWTISAPINCSEEINHNRGSITTLTCGPFIFSDVTRLEVNSTQLSSTIEATAMASMSGSVVECKEGTFLDKYESIDDISLCIIAPTNLQCNYSQNGLSVAWDSTGDSCYKGSVNYSVTVINGSNGTVHLSQDFVTQNKLLINITLEHDQNYSILFKLKASQCSGETEPAAVFAVCENFDNSKPEPDPNNGSSVSAAAVAVPIVLILALVAAIVIGMLIIFGCYYKKRGKLPFNLTLPFRKLKNQDSENSSSSHHPKSELQHTHAPADGAEYTKLQHTHAPDDAEYTCVDKVTKSTELQHTHAPDGAEYTCIDKVTKNTELQHTRAPDGAEYTCIDKVTKNTELQHTRAPDGAEYTCIDKITKSKDHKAHRDHSSDGSSNDSIEKIKNQDIKSDIDTKKEDSPPPKPRRATKTKDKPENKNKSESSEPPPSDPNKYEDIDDL